MTIRAFVGHSFSESDEEVVRRFTAYLDQIAHTVPNFTWVHAEKAEPRLIAEKVLALIEGQNLFIGICTRKEWAIEDQDLRPAFYSRKLRLANASSFQWKTSDWIIQEIGLAIGRGLHKILLLETGVRLPGALQGDVEYIFFERDYPEKCFGKLLEMISAFVPKQKLADVISLETEAPKPKQKTEEHESSDADWVTPQKDWSVVQYEWAYTHQLIVNGDESEEVREIDLAFLSSEHATDLKSRKVWDAYKENTKIWFGKSGSLNRLKELSDKNTEIGEIASLLGRAYEHYEEHEKAAHAFERAVACENNMSRVLSLMASIALARQRAGDSVGALEALVKMKAMADASSESAEIRVLNAEREIAALRNEEEISICALERLLDINPADVSTRFDLAFKYSKLDRYDLSLYHYLRIPHADRTGVTWNNIGVCEDRLGYPVSSVESYERAKDKNETLAMSNLAKRFATAGFLSEAEKITRTALAIEPHDESVEKVLGWLQDIKSDEDEKKEQAIDKAKAVSAFSKAFGKALAKADVAKLSPRWKHPNCELEGGIVSAQLILNGRYEQPQSGLMSMTLGGLLAGSSPGTPSTKMHIKLRGQVRGHAVVGHVIRRNETLELPQTILSSISDYPTMLMILSDDLKRIEVMERAKGGQPNFFNLTTLESS